MLSRSFVLTRTFFSLRQSQNNIKNTRILDSCIKFYSNDHTVRTVSVAPATKNDEKVEQEAQKLKFIQLEISLFSEQGKKVPDLNLIRKCDWDELLASRSKNARKKYYKYLFIRQNKKENNKKKNEEKSKASAASKEMEDRGLFSSSDQNALIRYSLSDTTFFLRIRGNTINSWRNNRLTQAKQFGDKLIFDCSYDQHMTSREAKSAAKQLMLCFSENRKHIDPFDLHFCNTNFNGHTMQILERHIPNMREETFPLNLHEGSYLDLFSKEKLVYLTPHCQNDLQEYDSDSIFIIGAMVDKHNHEPLSLAKAKEQGLKMARLPLDKYLQWGNSSGKSLTLDQMMKIMLELKTSRNWNSALKHVPSRKIVEETQGQSNTKKCSKNVDTFKKVPQE